MPSRPPQPSFSGKTQQQLQMWNAKTPAPPTETLSDGSVVERLKGKERVERLLQDTGAQSPSQPVTIHVNGESINLADSVRFPNASHDRTAWLKDIQAKIPPGEEKIETIRMVGGDSLGIFNDDGEQIKWPDGHWWK